MKIELLEKRLERVSPDGIIRVKRALTVPHLNPRERYQDMPYLKKTRDGEPGLTERIADVITSFGEELSKLALSKKLYATVNKEPLKRTLYGILSTGTLPEEFLEALTQWEKVFFYAGRWDIRRPDLTEPLDVLTVKHLRAGLNLLYSHHYRRKNRGIYTSELALPETKQVREAYERILAAYEKGKTEAKPKQPIQPAVEKKAKQGKLFETEYPVPFR